MIGCGCFPVSEEPSALSMTANARPARGGPWRSYGFTIPVLGMPAMRRPTENAPWNVRRTVTPGIPPSKAWPIRATSAVVAVCLAVASVASGIGQRRPMDHPAHRSGTAFAHHVEGARP